MAGEGEGSRRGQVAVFSALGMVAVLVAAAIVVVGVRHSARTVAEPATWVAAPAADPTSLVASPSASPSSSPTSGPSASASPKSSPTRKAPVKPVPSHTKVAAPPPAGKPVTQLSPSPGSSCPTYSGTAAPKSQVGNALDAAAGTSYKPYITDVPRRTITVSAVLLKSVAWQESGWQSNIVSCYHAYGAMQMTADTADWMNGNYGTTYDMKSVTGNASLGAGYLAWLVYYFGHFCFNDDYDLTHLNPDAPDLRDAVLAAYNLGVGAVDTPAGLVIPNRGYTNAVEGLMETQPWNAVS